MNKNTTKTMDIMAIINILMAIIMIVLVKYITPVCSGMLELTSGKFVYMKCHYTAVAIVFFGVLMIVNGILCLVTKEGFTSGLMGIALSLLVFIALNGTVGIGICGTTTMSCHVTAPVAQLCATIQILLYSGIAYTAKKKVKA